MPLKPPCPEDQWFCEANGTARKSLSILKTGMAPFPQRLCHTSSSHSSQPNQEARGWEWESHATSPLRTAATSFLRRMIPKPFASFFHCLQPQEEGKRVFEPNPHRR